MSGSDLNIIISAILDKPSLATIDSQLQAIKDKYTNTIINFDINTDAIKAIQGFTVAMEKFQAATDAQKKIIVQSQDVFKQLDGTVKTVTTSTNALGEITTKTRTIHDENKRAMQDESVAALKLAEGVQAANKADLDSITVMKNKANAISGLNVKSSSGYSVTNKRLEADGQTLVNSRTTTNYKKERDDIDQIESYRIESENNRIARERDMNASQQKAEYDAKVKAYEDTKIIQDKIDKDQVIAGQKNIKYDEDIANKKFDLETKIINMKRRFGDSVDTKGLDDLSAKIKAVDGTTVNATGSLKNIGQEIDRFGASVKVSGSHLIDFGEQLKYTATRMISFSLIGAPIAALTSFFKDGIQYVMEYNKALTLISSTTNKTSAEVQQIGKDFQQMGIQMGVASNDIAKGSIEFYRNRNLSNEQVKQDMQQVIEYARVSGTEIPASSKIVIAAMNTMKTSATNVTDVFTSIGDSVSSSANEIGTAFQYVGGEAESINIPFQKTAAYIGVISSVTKRSAEEIGTAIKSIYARAESLKTTGFNDDGQDKTQVAKALDSIGVKLFDTQGQFRNFGVVLDETGAKWNSLDTRHKQYISTVLGGTYQASNFNILMQNYAETLKLTDIAMNSAGTTAQKFALVQEGVAAHTQRLSSTLQNLWSDSFKTNGIIGVVDGLTSLISAVDSVVNKFGFLPTIVFTASTAMLAFKASIISNAALGLMGESLKSVSMAIAIYTESTIAARIATIGLQAAMTLGLSLAITGLVAGISYLYNSNAKLAEQHAKQEAQNKVITDSWNAQKDTVNALVAEYNKLDETTNRTAEQDKRYLDVTNQLSKLMPNLVASIDAKGVSHLKTADAIAKELDYAEKLTKLENEKALTSAKKDFGTDVSNLKDLQDQLAQKNDQLKYKRDTGADVHGFTHNYTADELEGIQIEILGLTHQVNDAVEAARSRILSLSTTVATLAGVKVGDNVSAELKKITESLNVDGLDSTKLAAKSNELGKLVVELNKIKTVQSSGDSGGVHTFDDSAYLKQASAIGLTVDQMKNLEDAYLGIGSKTEQAKQQTIDYTDSIAKLDKEITTADKSISSLSSAYQKLQNGEQLSVDETLKLVAEHPQLLDYLSQHNGLITDKGAILQQVANIERTARLDEAQGLLDSVTDTYNALESKKTFYADFYTKVLAGSPLLDSAFLGFGKNRKTTPDGKVDFSAQDNTYGLTPEDQKTLDDYAKSKKELQLRVDLLKQPIDLAKVTKSGSGDLTPSQSENIANNPYQRDSKILEGALKASEAAMTHYNSTSKEYRDELQKQYEIQLKQRDLEHTEADRIRGVNVELQNQLNTESLSATQRKQTNKQIEDNLNTITDLGEKWQQATLNAEDDLKKKSTSSVDETIQNLDAETKIYDDKIKNLKTSMSSLKNDPADKIKDQGILIQTYSDENALILKHVETLNAESAALDKNSDAWKKKQDQIAKEKAKYEQNNADVESVREKIAAETVDLMKKAEETQKTSELFVESERHNNKVKNIDDEFNKQITNMERLQQTQDFQKNLEKDDKDAAKIQAEIDARSNDNSNDGKSRVIDLKQQLAVIQEKIADETSKRQNDIVKQGLQDQNKTSKDLEDQKNQTTVDGINEKYDQIINDDTKWLGIEKDLINGHTTEVNTQMEGLITSLGTFATNNADIVGAHVSAVKKMVDELTGAKVQVGQLTTTPPVGTSGSTPQTTGSTPSTSSTPSMTWQESLAKVTIDDAYAASEIKRAQAIYNTDKLNGDTVGADAAHKWADQVRAANPNVASMDTGGYTGNFSGSKYLLAHEKELMLNKNDTSNMLKIINMVRDIMPDFSKASSKGSSQVGGSTYSVSFGNVYVTGDKKGADTLFNEFENGLRRMGVVINH